MLWDDFNERLKIDLYFYISKNFDSVIHVRFPSGFTAIFPFGRYRYKRVRAFLEYAGLIFPKWTAETTSPACREDSFVTAMRSAIPGLPDVIQFNAATSFHSCGRSQPQSKSLLTFARESWTKSAKHQCFQGFLTFAPIITE